MRKQPKRSQQDKKKPAEVNARSEALPAYLQTSELLSRLADEALRAVDFDPTRYDSEPAPEPVQVLSFSKTGRINLRGKTAREIKVEEAKRRLDSGFYGSAQVTEQLAERLTNELGNKKKRKG